MGAQTHTCAPQAVQQLLGNWFLVPVHHAVALERGGVRLSLRRLAVGVAVGESVAVGGSVAGGGVPGST